MGDGTILGAKLTRSVATTVAGILALLFSPCPTSMAKQLPLTPFTPGSPSAEFTTKATNGYFIGITGSERQVTMTVNGHGGTATYSVIGQASTSQLKARFGKLGRIAVRFKPTGKQRHIKPPRGCQGRDQITTSGAFIGTIHFRGERGYTRLIRKRVRGSTTTSPRWRCKPQRGSNGETERGFGQLRLTIPVLAAFTPNSRTIFTALGENKSEDLDLTLFVAGTRERRGSMRIDRFTIAFAKSRAFIVEPDLGAATVQPSKPFSGSGVFTRNADGSTVWEGSLGVALPGAGVLPLTGPTFTADLARPKTLAEFAALLGQPGGVFTRMAATER
jgi:hypothetical protein